MYTAQLPRTTLHGDMLQPAPLLFFRPDWNTGIASFCSAVKVSGFDAMRFSQAQLVHARTRIRYYVSSRGMNSKRNNNTDSKLTVLKQFIRLYFKGVYSQICDKYIPINNNTSSLMSSSTTCFISNRCQVGGVWFQSRFVFFRCPKLYKRHSSSWFFKIETTSRN